MNAADLIDQTAAYLSDNEVGFEHEHWSRSDLFGYYRLAISLVAGIRRELFTRTVESPLVAGALQTLPPECESVVDRRVASADGRRLRVLSGGLHEFAGLALCATTGDGGAPSAVSFVPGDARNFIVDPPVGPAGAPPVFVTCFAPPTIASETAEVMVPESLRPAVFELMLYYAFGVDTESVPARDRSAVHWANAMTLLGASSTRKAAK